MFGHSHTSACAPEVADSCQHQLVPTPGSLPSAISVDQHPALVMLA